MTDKRTTELQSLSKLKRAGSLHFWRGTIEVPESELHAICDEIQAEHEGAIAATLGSGMLTAEQVREAIFNGSSYASYDGAMYYANGISMQAIADELNAALGSGMRERTCEYKPMWDVDDPFAEEYLGMWHTGCGDALTWNSDNDGCCKPPTFCPYCGAKVIEG